MSETLAELLGAGRAVVRTGELLAAGLTRQDLRKLAARDWWRVGNGVWLTEPRRARDPEQRAASALALAADGAVVSHVTAGRVLGFRGLDGLPGFDQRDPAEPEHVTLNRRCGVRSPTGLVVHRTSLADRDTIVLGGLRITSAIRTAADILLTEPRAVGVVAVDSAIREGLLPTNAAPLIANILKLRRGAAQARRYLRLVDGRAESPLETLSRLHFVDEHLPVTDLQFLIRDAQGVLVGRADFLFEGPTGRRVLGEADGQTVHDPLGVRHQDLKRENLLRDLGYDVVRWTWADLLGHGPAPADMVRRALARG